MSVGGSVDSFFNRLRLAVAALVSLAIVSGAGATHAMPAYIPIVQNFTTVSFAGGQTVGSILTATTTQTFHSLGFIDVNATTCNQGTCTPDGLLGSYQVGIWLASTQTLLASAWVQPTSPLGTFLDGGYQFRWASIPTVTIPAGQQFVIAALLPASPLDPFLVNPTYLNKTGITGSGLGRFEVGGTLTYPTQNYLGTYAVANASEDSYVPEPTTAVSLFFGLIGLATFRRHRRVA